jgi:hypothetical protein
MVVACAYHWYIGALYAAPVVLIVIPIAHGKWRDRRARRGRGLTPASSR